MPRFVFNRRTVEDQLVYIDAPSRKDAESRARNDNADNTSDATIIKITYRFVGEEAPYAERG